MSVTITPKINPKTIEIIRKSYDQSKTQSIVHDWKHVLRVLDNCYLISKDFKKVDTESLSLAALLHDVDQPFNNKKQHVLLSIKKSKTILQEIGVYTNIQNKVLNIISEHSTEDLKNNLSCIESGILFDADKIDGVGIVGITRVLMFCGQSRKTIRECMEWYKEKVIKTLPNLRTETGKAIFLERLQFTKKYITELNYSLRNELEEFVIVFDSLFDEMSG